MIKICLKIIFFFTLKMIMVFNDFSSHLHDSNDPIQHFGKITPKQWHLYIFRPTSPVQISQLILRLVFVFLGK